MRIAVYCSARPDIPGQFHDDARMLGQWIGSNGHTLVYGGLSYSMMDDVATATVAAGGKVMGIVPRSRMERQHPDNTVSIHVETLHERKQMMEENADIFVALEGGLGTLDEVFSAVASATFFKESVEIHLLDRDGLYQPLKQLFGNMKEKGLITGRAADCIHFHPDVEAMTAALEQANQRMK